MAKRRGASGGREPERQRHQLAFLQGERRLLPRLAHRGLSGRGHFSLLGRSIVARPGGGRAASTCPPGNTHMPPKAPRAERRSRRTSSPSSPSRNGTTVAAGVGTAAWRGSTGLSATEGGSFLHIMLSSRGEDGLGLGLSTTRWRGRPAAWGTTGGARTVQPGSAGTTRTPPLRPPRRRRPLPWTTTSGRTGTPSRSATTCASHFTGSGVEAAVAEPDGPPRGPHRRPGGLGVEHPHPARADDQMVEVGPAARHLPVVQDRPGPGGEAVEEGGGGSFTGRAAQPALGVRSGPPVPPGHEQTGAARGPTAMARVGPSASRCRRRPGPRSTSAHIGAPGGPPPAPAAARGGTPRRRMSRPGCAQPEDKPHPWYSSHRSGLLVTCAWLPSATPTWAVPTTR